jgi:hypothetical protein
MSEKQSKMDSWMEAITNTVVGFVVSIAANALILPALFGMELSFAHNILCALAFTGVSIIRQYVLRRIFNGRSVWQAIRASFREHGGTSRYGR